MAETAQRQKTEIYNQFNAKVQNYIFAKVKNDFVTEDICSKVFVRVVENEAATGVASLRLENLDSELENPSDDKYHPLGIK